MHSYISFPSKLHQKIHRNNVEFSSIEIGSKKISKLHRRKYIETASIFRPSKLHQKGMSKWRRNLSIFSFRRNYVILTSNRPFIKICSLYVNEDNSLVMSNNLRWELRSHVTCRDIKVICLKFNMCDHKETYIGKTDGNNVVGFKSRISQHSTLHTK